MAIVGYGDHLLVQLVVVDNFLRCGGFLLRRLIALLVWAAYC